MKRNYPAILAIGIFGSLIIVGSALCVINSSSRRHGETWEKQGQVAAQNVIKVHTDRGVITLPGRADSWDAAEHAEFVADSLADVQIVNNEVSIFPLSND